LDADAVGSEGGKQIMDLDDIKRGLRAEIKKRENEQYLTFQCNVRQMCKDVLAKLEEQESEIAELKAQKAQAEDDCAYWKMSEGNAAKAMHETEEYAMQLYNEASHSKHKRCLAMASKCRLRARWFGDNAFYKKEQWALQWHRRWLELAEKFKPNREAK
jgi:hypothetical protein